MRLNVDIVGLRQVQQQLQGFSDRRLNAALATALTRTAVEVREAVYRQLPRFIDRPTPYTMNSLFLKGARADRLTAEVWFKQDDSRGGRAATKYLLPQVEGGVGRSMKGIEVALRAAGHLPAGWYVVPGGVSSGGALIDQYGNIPKGQIIQILSQLRITLVSGHVRNMAQEPAKQIRAQRKAGGRYFVIRPGTAKTTPPGVYRRDFAGRRVTPVLIFVRRVSYQPRLPFYALATRVAEERLGPQVQRAIGEHAARVAERLGRVL